MNPNALDIARQLDVERRTKGRRSPLHGIPVVLKDNIDTADMPTTAGSILLEGSIPPDDAFVPKRLRDSGAIILGKANMSEFASGIARSSLGGQMKNPHDLARSSHGSSGGTGNSVTAAFAVIGVGTDTGGSIRNPSAATVLSASSRPMDSSAGTVSSLSRSPSTRPVRSPGTSTTWRSLLV